MASRKPKETRLLKSECKDSTTYWHKLEQQAKTISGLTQRQYRALPRKDRAVLREQAKKQIGHYHGSPAISRWVYVISHPSWPDHCKIGEATKPRVRLASYNTGCPHKGYRLELAEFCQNSRVVAASGYGELAEHRTHGEWFAVNSATAIEAVLRHQGEML